MDQILDESEGEAFADGKNVDKVDDYFEGDDQAGP